MATEANNFLMIQEIKTANATNLSLLREWKTVNKLVLQFSACPFQSWNGQFCPVHFYVLLLLCISDNCVKASLVSQFCCSNCVVFEIATVWKLVINVAKTNDPVFKCLLVWKFLAFIATACQNRPNDEKWNPYKSENSMLDCINYQNLKEMSLLITLIGCFFWNKITWSCRLFKNLVLHKHGVHCVTENSELKTPFEKGWPFTTFVSAESLHATVAN